MHTSCATGSWCAPLPVPCLRTSANGFKGARVAEKVDLRTEPLVVARRVSSSGVIGVGGQRVVVGAAHRCKTVDVLVDHRYLHILDNGTTLKIVAATPPRR